MTETLRQKQSRFARQLPRLIDYAVSLGYDVTLGELYRSDEQAEIHALGPDGRAQVATLVEHQFPLLARKVRNNTGNGIRTSLHTQRLAIDLQLFDGHGRWVTEVDAYRVVGEFWEQIAPDHCWGGRFGDTPHYSIEHEGRK
jgi:hypothetical protein